MEQREVPVNQLTLPASHDRQLENRMHNIMPADCSQHHKNMHMHTVCKLFAEQARSRRSVNCFLTVYNVTSTRGGFLPRNKLKRGQLYCQEISTNSVPSCFRNPYSLVPKMNFIFVRILWCKGVPGSPYSVNACTDFGTNTSILLYVCKQCVNCLQTVS
jgi:hypothetical protein